MDLFSFYNNKYIKMENEISEIKINIQNNDSLTLNKTNIKDFQHPKDFQNSDNTQSLGTETFQRTFPFQNIQDNQRIYCIDTKTKASKEDSANREKFYKKTPNTKIQILTQEIYMNRKNTIKNCEKNTNQYKINIKSLPINTSFHSNNYPFKNNERIFESASIPINSTDRIDRIERTLPIEYSLNNGSFSSITKLNNLHSYQYENQDFSKSNSNTDKKLKNDSTCKIIEKIIENGETENTDERLSSVISTDNISSGSCSREVENTSPELTDSTDSIDSTEHTKTYEHREKHFKEPKKRHYRRFNKFKKKNQTDSTDTDINCTNDNYYNDDLSQSDCSPRILDTSLWNDDIENYYIEFQKICIDESIKYKQLNYRHEFVSNLLKFILLLSSCFTFTLSLSSPSSVFFQVSTTITSILTTIITSIISFFTFEKRSEIEYYIYKGLDKINQNISIELIKPPQIRCDPYELILSLQNQRDELLKKLHKKI